MTRVYWAFLAIGAMMMWAVGCQEEQVSSDVKQSRLIAAENGDLKTQLQQEAKKHDEEIKNLNTQMQTETKKQDDKITNLKTQLQTEAKKRDEEIKNLNSFRSLEIAIRYEIERQKKMWEEGKGGSHS